MKLRNYQASALDGIRTTLNESDSTLLVLATGLGKTIVFSHLAKEYMERGRIMVLAHREELIGQAFRHLESITSTEPDTEMGDWHAPGFGAYKSDIVVGTIQTQIAGRNGYNRMSKFDPNEFSLLVIDEAHHAAAASYRKVIEYYRRNENLKVLGVTATPDRADEKALGEIFDTVAYEYEISDAINDGWLVPICQRSVYVEGLDYSSVRTTAGDLNGKDLAAVLEFEETLHKFASPIVELTGDKKTLIFAASLIQAERLTEIINRHKPGSARWVHGGTPKEERRDLWPQYANGEFQYLVNVGITTEGWDEPSVEVICQARPTKSRSLYAQMIGRGTRALTGLLDNVDDVAARKYAISVSRKTRLEVIDFVGNSGRHKLITPSDILGGKYGEIQVGDDLISIVDRANENAAKKSAETGVPVDVADELDNAERQLKQEAREEEERKIREGVKLRARYSTAEVNPFRVYNITPWREKEWNKGREPTEKQIEFLKRSGVDVSGLKFTGASQLIDTIIKRRKEKLATFKQTKVLQKFGYETDRVTFKEAGEIINELARNNWKRPA